VCVKVCITAPKRPAYYYEIMNAKILILINSVLLILIHIIRLERKSLR